MALISLTSYFLETTSHPAAGKILVPSIAIPGGKPGPEGCIIMGHGVKDSMLLLQKARFAAREKNRLLYRVDTDVEVGTLGVGRLDLEDLEKTKILNLKRLKVNVAEALLDVLRDSNDQVADPSVILGNHPDRIAQVFKAEMFSHLSVIVWPAPLPTEIRPDGSPKTIQLAAVKSSDLLLNPVVRNYPIPVEEITFLPADQQKG